MHEIITPEEKEKRELRTTECLGAAIKAIVASGGRIVRYDIDNEKDRVKMEFTLRPRFKPKPHEEKKKGRSRNISPLEGVRKTLEDKITICQLHDVFADMVKKRKEQGLADPTLEVFKDLIKSMPDGKIPNDKDFIKTMVKLLSRSNDTKHDLEENARILKEINEIMDSNKLTKDATPKPKKDDLFDGHDLDGL